MLKYSNYYLIDLPTPESKFTFFIILVEVFFKIFASKSMYSTYYNQQSIQLNTFKAERTKNTRNRN